MSTRINTLHAVAWGFLVPAIVSVATSAVAEDAQWYQARRQVLSELGHRNVIPWSNELAGRLDGADRRTLFTALHVFIRAGRTDRVPDVVRGLGPLGLRPPVQHGVTELLAENELWDSLRIFLDVYPKFRPLNEPDFRKFRDHWWQTGDRAELEAWLKTRYEKDSETWHQDYFRVLARLGKIAPLAAELRRQIVENPTDGRLARNYVAAVKAIERSDRPAIAWLGDVARPKFAIDAFDLGNALAGNVTRGNPLDGQYHHVQAIRLFEHALSRPITDYDRNQLSKRWSMSPASDPEKFIRRCFKTALARTCQAAGRIERAQKLVQELVGPDATLADIHTLRFAGQIQAQSGRRVVAKRIEKAEEEKKDTVQYWVGRASYYVGRKEDQKAEAAFRKALALPPDSFTPRAVIQYARYLHYNKGRLAEANRLLRKELKRIGPNHDYADSLLSKLLMLDGKIVDGKRPVTISADDALLWEYLAGRKRYGSSREKDLLETLAKKGNPEEFWAKALKLAGPDTDPTHCYVVGELLLACGRAAEAIPLLEDAFRRWTRPNTRYQKAPALLSAYLKRGDWRAAEKFFFRIYGKMPISKVWEAGVWKDGTQWWLGKLAVAAARDGAKDDSLRLWKTRANLDVRNLDKIREMVTAGMKEPLRELYSDLARLDPDNQAVAAALTALE